jgi:hypothetical protein
LLASERMRTFQSSQHKPRLDKQPLEAHANSVRVCPLRARSSSRVAVLKPLGRGQSLTRVAAPVKPLGARRWCLRRVESVYETASTAVQMQLDSRNSKRR